MGSTEAMESSKLAPPDGMEDATFFFDELCREVGAWSQKNFGDQLPHRPMIGIVEELCELDEGLEEKDPAKTIDAMGGVVIYMADYHYRRGWSLGETWQGRPTQQIVPDGKIISKFIRLLCHSHLKSEQNIRGGSAKHDAKMKDTCSGVLAYLEHLGVFMDRDVCGIIQETWETVSKRDWTKNPNNAHEVAELGSPELQRTIDQAFEELETELTPPAPFPLAPSAFPKDESPS
jgi:hypothetical protein